MTHHRFPTTKPRKRKTWRACPRLEMLEDRTAPAVIVVQNTNDAGADSLRAAITTAVGSAENDQIVFAAALQGQTITLASALPDINAGGDLSIIGPGGVKSGITVDGNNAVRPFNITAGAGAVVLTNLTVTRGNSGAGNSGGAVQNAGTNTTLSNVLVTQSTADQNGGGIQNVAAGVLTVTNSTVENNSTTNEDGGGIFNTGTLTVNTSRVLGNRSGDNGGGILNAGATATATVSDTTVASNFSTDDGGGIENQFSATMTIRSSTVSGNRATTSAGGVRNFNLGTLTVLNSTIAQNIAAGDIGGGGASITSGTVTIVNSTISGNADTSNNAQGAGGISKIGGTLTLANSIVAGNEAAPGSVAENIEPGDINIDNDNLLTGNPVLGSLQDNGGPTFTLAPLAGSPVIDAGTNAFATETGAAGGTTLMTDQRGFARIVGGTVDQGAVERFSSTTTVMLEVLQDGMAVTGTSTARPVTLRATVTSGTAGVTPTGSVNFYRDPTPTDPTDAPVQLNSTPVALDDMGVASLPNVPLPSTSGLFARYVPSSAAFDPSASAQQTITATIRSTVGVFDPNAVFQLLNQNTTTTTGPDFSYSFGFVGSQPVVGNWTGSASGVALPGIVRVAGGSLEWTLADENPPVLPNLPSFNFGAAGQTAVSGDWDGDGTDGIGVYDPASGQWQLRNTPGAGAADFTFAFGGAGFLPVVGDWDGDGSDTVGVYNPTSGQWILAGNSPATGFPTPFGAAFNFGGQAGSRPVAGDWDGNGTDGIGVFFPQAGADAGFGGFLLRNTPDGGPADVNGGAVILAGLDFWLPVTGNWGIAPTTSNELLAPSPLMLGEGGVPGGQSINALQLQSLVEGALGRLASVDADPAVLNALIETQFVLADLPGSTLGLADVANSRVLIDVDGAGAGWFVDGTPWEDSEFASAPVSGVDLLTAVLHEMGHVAGHDHQADGLMAGSLSAGVRHTDALDALFGSGLGEPGIDAPEVAIP